MEQISKRLMNWASILEDNTRQQAVVSSLMPFIHPHIALMPDAHLGMGATVGSVIPTLGAIMPAAIGVDIGCGMMAVRTNWTYDQIPGYRLHDLREAIEHAIPVSKGGYNGHIWGDHTAERIDRLRQQAEQSGFDPGTYAGNWELQLGTLGSGNHFIEVSLDEEDRVWLFLHSGSRGVGNRIAQRHIKIAQAIMGRYFIDLVDPNLAYLVEGTPEFWAYIREMRWAQQFAYENRAEMMDRVRHAVEEWTGGPVVATQAINCHHNYTQQEKHFGKNVWLSRKGAIDAHEGVWGLIPGSMGTRSYVVQGKGNPLALHSSPHGAGRVHSRTVARRTFTEEDLEKAMVGIEWRHTDAFLDEHPGAYKDIDQVMQDAADLVEVRYTLRQIVNVKGD